MQTDWQGGIQNDLHVYEVVSLSLLINSANNN